MDAAPEPIRNPPNETPKEPRHDPHDAADSREPTSDTSTSKETEMTTQTRTTGAARFILQKRSILLAGLRLVPVAAMLFGVASMAPDASATSCYQPASIAVNGGSVSNRTTVDLSADGGTAGQCQRRQQQHRHRGGGWSRQRRQRGSRERRGRRRRMPTAA